MNSADSPHRRSVFKTLALWLGLAALMVQAVVPLCAPMLMGGTGGGVASVVMCTAHGFETVQIGTDGKSLPQQPANNASDCCVACHAPMGFSVPSPIPVAAPSSIAYRGTPIVSAPFVAARLYSSYVTRGPPTAISNEFA